MGIRPARRWATPVELTRLIEELGVGNATFLGFLQYDELPAYYGLAGAFVHGSHTEQWGLVVNEAMAVGLPVLVSRRCGCAYDLVQEGVNGFPFDPHDVDQLAHLLLRVAGDSAEATRLGAASRQIIRNWGLDRFAGSPRPHTRQSEG
jgi:glycosyltransferase involved in cell wall biosynthesis